MKTKAAAAVPSRCDSSGSAAAWSCDVLIRAATKNRHTAWMANDVMSDLTRPILSMTKAAAAVPGTPKVLARPASQRAL